MSVAITVLSPRPLVSSLPEAILQRLRNPPFSLEWLDERVCDLIVDVSLEDVQRRLSPLPQGPLDIIIQPSHGRKKKILIADMESTLVENEFLDELAAYCGIQERMSRITDRAMNGLMDFEEAFYQRIHLLKGLPLAVFDKVWSARTRFAPGAFCLVETMRAKGALTILVSGGLGWFAQRVARALGIDEYYSNDVEAQGGLLTGRPQGPIVTKTVKERILLDSVAKLGLSPEAVVAVGDGDNDLPMLRRAGLGCAYRAKEKVRRLAPHHLAHTNLTSLLYAQGYSTQEFRKTG